jgi:molecular chaperone Hsp33
MIKKHIPGLSKKEQLQARADNRLHKFLLADGQLRGAILQATHTVKEMRLNHELGILETLVLGHSYMGVSLMAGDLKGHDRIAFRIECSGPLKGLSVEATATGEVRGYLKTNPIPIDKPLESFDLTPFFGNGLLIVTRYPQNAKQPYVGQVHLVDGSISINLAHYYSSSEQTPTAFNLSVKFDPEGNVLGAGGLLVQAMPDADPDLIKQLDQVVRNLPSIGETIAAGQSPGEFVLTHFLDLKPKLLDTRRVEFFCPCRKETVAGVIKRVSKDELKDIAENGPFPLATRCHNCNTVYQFEKEELLEFYKNSAE